MTGTIELSASFFKRRSHRPGNLVKHNVTQLGIEQRPEFKHHLWGRERERVGAERERERESWGRERESWGRERESWGRERECVCEIS